MLLVLTGSHDGTADILFTRLGKKAFRLNYDIFSDYSLNLRPESWFIANPAGLCIDNTTASAVFWWKAFNYFAETDKYVAEEVKYIFRELYAWFLDRERIRGTNPEYHRYNGKITLLHKASKYFKIPETVCGWGDHFKPPEKAIVAKSLSSGLITTDKALFTTEVQASKLDLRFPWYTQEKIDAVSDVTVFICGIKLFAFQRDRSDLKGLDWRNQSDIFDLHQKWVPFDLNKAQKKDIEMFITTIGVDWGRIDFLWTGVELIFLEYNANGQFIFLDEENKFGVIDAAVDYLLRDSAN